ncbi:hypothetical protein OQH61_09450, partial [Helicobacter sp. MIT 21-1697]|uniref:hypothetical protein n=1 Tax=Helicobacter sp. MIT 21-1697 TaxID=2993733 RepID=UPI00224AAB72
EAKRSLIAQNKAFLNTRERIVGDKKGARDYDKDLKSTQSYIQQGLCTYNQSSLIMPNKDTK